MTTATIPKPAPAVAAAAPPFTRPILGLFSLEGLAVGAVLTLAFGGLFYRWFYTQHLFSSSEIEDWGHAYLIPIISGYLIWQHRDALSALQPRVFWPGLAPFLLGIMCYFFFIASRLPGGHMIQGWALIMTLFGLVLLMLGPGAMRYLFLPIAFLIFGITVSQMIMIRLTFPLQLIAAQGAYVLLSVIGAIAGFTADVHGTQLEVITSAGTAVPLDIAAACAGMRTVVAFFALGAATALLACRFWWQRIALLLLAAPVAIIINIGRVATLGLLALGNANLAQGQAHTLIGTLLLIPGLGLFLGIVWILNRLVGEPAPARGAAA